MQTLPLLGITGYSGSGKTTLLEKLLPELQKLGLRVAVIKHSHHKAQIDKPGKDSWRMKEAGATQVALASDERWALMTETKTPVSLAYLALQFNPQESDLILVEGFKHEPIQKILLHRQEMTKPLAEQDEFTLALATNYPVQSTLPCLNIDCPREIAQFIAQWLETKRAK